MIAALPNGRGSDGDGMNGTPRSLTTPADGLLPAAGCVPTANKQPAQPFATGRIVLANLYDPEWLPFILPLCVPSLFCLLFGQFQRAGFFAGLALYLGVLKWLGWLVLTRRWSITPRFMLWPAELFAGLAVLVAWFYVRNFLGWLWPASYSLVELRVLPFLVVGLHLLVRGARSVCEGFSLADASGSASFGLRAAMFGPFVLALVVALAQVSGSMGVQAVDPVLHAFQAKVYVHDGLFHPVGPNQVVLRYPSGFAAINAVTAAVSFLTPVQAVNLQHILWIIVSLFLVTGTMATFTKRPLPVLHAAVLPFLALFPIYALIPDYGYSGTPRQMAPPFLLAVVMLPAVAPLDTRMSRFRVVTTSMFLAILTLVLNPICAPFTLAAVASAAVIFVLRQTNPLRRTATSAVLFIGALGLSAAVVLGMDRHYATYLHKPTESSVLREPGAELPVLKLSAGAALSALQSVNPLDLTPTVMLAEEAYPHPAELHWTERYPQRLAPWLAEAALLLALFFIVRRRSWDTVPGSCAVVWLLIGSAAVWLLLKYGIAVATSAVSSSGWKAEMFSVYLKTILTRTELLVLFSSFAAATTLLTLILASTRRRLLPQLAPVAWLALALLTAGFLVAPHSKSGYLTMPVGAAYAMTAADHELAAWADGNIPPENGLIGLAATTFTWGPEKHVYAIGGAQAVVQFGRHDNFRFGLRALERNQGYDDYVTHVRDRFDPAWCLAQDIRFFYADEHGLQLNPGLAHALAAGQLRVLHKAGDSAIYEVVGGNSP